MTYLLDANALIALSFPDHVHHRPIRMWIAGHPKFAVCPITEGALVRFIVRTFPNGAGLASATLEILSRHGGYEFWPDDISYASANLARVAGHKQVTDSYLVALATARGGQLATFDSALAAIHSEALQIPFKP